jgi:hypothetical protein
MSAVVAIKNNINEVAKVSKAHKNPKESMENICLGSKSWLIG